MSFKHTLWRAIARTLTVGRKETPHAQRLRHHLGHLGVQALAHLGAAMVHLHAAVGVHMHQRTRLVEQCGREADAELQRRDRQPALFGLVRVPVNSFEF
jgi:hypothetical protein